MRLTGRLILRATKGVMNQNESLVKFGIHRLQVGDKEYIDPCFWRMVWLKLRASAVFLHETSRSQGKKPAPVGVNVENVIK